MDQDSRGDHRKYLTESKLNTELLLQHLPACCHVHHDDSGLNLELSKPRLKACRHQSCLGCDDQDICHKCFLFFPMCFSLKIHRNFILKMCFSQQVEENKSRSGCSVTCLRRLMGIKVRTQTPLSFENILPHCFQTKQQNSKPFCFSLKKPMCSYYIPNCPDFII